MRIFTNIIFSILLLANFLPASLLAQELIQDKTEIVKAEVVEVLSQTKENIPGIDMEGVSQTIVVKILEGDQNGEIITIENDYILLEKGDKFFLYHSIDSLDGREMYSVRDVDRRTVIIFFIALFVVVVLIFSGKQGLRSLIGLAGSFFVIFGVLKCTTFLFKISP